MDILDPFKENVKGAKGRYGFIVLCGYVFFIKVGK
jgi:hypothetical protein